MHGGRGDGAVEKPPLTDNETLKKGLKDNECDAWICGATDAPGFGGSG